MDVFLGRLEAEHAFHSRLHSFIEALEQVVAAILLVMLGRTISALLSDLNWRYVVALGGLVFVFRPALRNRSLTGTAFSPSQHAMVAIYGIRDIGSIYYMAYARARPYSRRQADYGQQRY